MAEHTRAQPPPRGRGATDNPTGRFEPLQVETVDDGWETPPDEAPLRTRFFHDTTRDALARNDSPDLGFDYSVNPYRGCEHGCSYCYARPSHEYLGLSAGLDFESRIMVKTEAAARLAERFRSPRWQPQMIMLSGNTDCYQPVERRLGITRACLEVCLDFRHPVGVITKNALILRDLDLLAALAREGLVAVTISVTSLDAHLARTMEPRASAPHKRLEAIARLAEAGIPVTVNAASVIPALNDHELPAILREAAQRGARGAGYILLRLPHGVKELFVEWLATHFPARKDKVLGAIRESRDGRLNDPAFGSRMKGRGPRATAVKELFHLHCRRLGLDTTPPVLNTGAFRRPAPESPQLALPI